MTNIEKIRRLTNLLADAEEGKIDQDDLQALLREVHQDYVAHDKKQTAAPEQPAAKPPRAHKLIQVPGTSFQLDETPVTWAQYAALVPGTKIPEGKHDHPVVHVSWWDAAEFCNRRSVAAGLRPYYVKLDREVGTVHVDPQADGYRLPDEDLWERACLAGSPGPYCCDEADLPKYAHYNASDTAPVGSKLPNAWGLYDMHGNVWEWCDNVYRERK